MATVLITGANRGIGLALAQQCAMRGDTVIAACRVASPALRMLANVRVEEGVDVANMDSLRALDARLGRTMLDVLICNAGIFLNDRLGQFDNAAWQTVRQQFEVNTLGPLRTVEALLERLGDGAKVGIITSRMGSIADNSSGGYYGYRASKAAVNAIGKSLANDLQPRGVTVLLLHPGYVATDMVGGKGDISADTAATQLLQRLDSLGLEQSGCFYHANGSALPW